MSRSNVRCVNCELRLSRPRLRLSNENEDLLNIIRLWTYPRETTDADFVCQACWELASHATNQVAPERQVGHQNVCVGCGRSILRSRSRLVLRENSTDEEQQLAAIISQWMQHHQLTPTDEACGPCWLRAQRILRRSTNTQNAQFNSGASEDMAISPHQSPQHEEIGDCCVNCDIQLLSAENRHCLSSESEHFIRVIKLWTYPRNIVDTDYVCHICWELANHQVLSEIPEENPVQQSGNQQIPQQQYITLPNIRRAADTRRHCLFPDCRNPERYHIPDTIRRRVLSDCNFYIPRGARICSYHMGRNMFGELYTSENTIDHFNCFQIEDMVFIQSEPVSVFNFEDIQSLPEYLAHYFLGISLSQHQQIINETRGLREMHRGSFALTALLCKLRTGDSGDRLSSLFQTPRRTVETLMNKARDILAQEYVPQHLGLHHISRSNVINKNSYIANSLYGRPDLLLERQNAIVICDGTYVYAQKSSNYLFQKETYSLHKYRNLLKPFMIVCCNGYILDITGPYPATTNDASIMMDLLNKDSFLDFFRDDDVFILDRGFRDSVDAIHQRGFLAHLPETLSPGQFQLTTLERNRSRCVTINRWVVEAVNGRIKTFDPAIKRDFKIFRHEYFNRACPHMMKDFSIAAALHNAFATMFVDPSNAEQIVNIINERLFVDNTLAEIVQEENLNRRSSIFTTITNSNIVFPSLSIEELVLFACGTYQIRQARSYIGEQLRFHGLYTIEVCREDHVNLSRLGGISPYLIRAKVKSRHVSRKSYYVFISIDRQQVGTNAITGYCCNCIVGLRTVGCCSHVMSIVWYLGYARHQDNITPPAQFLDQVLLRLDT